MPDIFRNKKILALLIIIIISIPTTILTSVLLSPPQKKPNFVSVVGGTLTEDTTWQGHISVQQNVMVPQNITLTILPGTFIEFKDYRGL